MEFVGDILLPASLWFIMFSMGLSLTLQDFARVFANRRALIVGVCSMLVVLPLLGAVIATLFAPTAMLAVGFVLLATCPGGMLSNLMTDIADGDLALSLSLTIIVSFIYLLVVPFYALAATSWFLGVDSVVEVPVLEAIRSVLSITLVPVSLGILVRRFKAGLAIAAKPYVKWIATAVLVVAFIMILIDQAETLKAAFGPLLFMVVLMNVLALAIAFNVCRAARVEDRERRAICIEHLIRQEGTAMYIAVTILGSAEMSLPMIVNTPVGLALCVAFVTWARRRGGERVRAHAVRAEIER